MTGMSAPARRRRLSLTEKLWLSAEILVAYVRTRRALRRWRLLVAVAEVRGSSSPVPEVDDDPYAMGLRLSAAVRRVLEALPWDPRCLTTSLVLSAMLARRGIPSTLVIGVRPDPFGAHAWVEYDGRPLLPPAGEPFARLLEI